MSFKKFVRQVHLILGLASGLVVFTVAVTGCIYCFEKEIKAVVYKDYIEVSSAKQTRANISEVVELAKKSEAGKKIKFVSVPAQTNESVQVLFRDKTLVFVDPYQLKVLGSYNVEKEFFGVVLDLHRNLLMGKPGKNVTGISALIFLIMIISGIIMWWPRNRKALNAGLTIKKDASKKRKTLDLHRVLGFYASFVLIFSVLTGILWSFKWADASMWWLTGSKKDERKYKSVETKDNKTSVDFIAAAVFSRYPSKAMTIVFPEDADGAYRVSVTQDEDGFLKKQDHFFFDQYSGKTLAEKFYKNSSTGERVKSANYNVHTGKVLGLFGQLLMFFASTIAASLPVTGFLIWYRRR